jgi:glycosyltransferase involved in cell wall biosynthesis
MKVHSLAGQQYKVVVGSPSWQLNGVNVFAEHLTRGLVQRGVDAHLFLTEHDTWLVQLPKELMPFPADIPKVEIDTPHLASWEEHWYRTIKYLESLAPCIYLPNSDFRHSCITPLLSKNIAVVGLIQGDDPIHYEHVHRLGRYWDAIVCVSEEIADKVARQDPDYRPRIHSIPNTVVVPSTCPGRHRKPGDPLRIVYHGVFNTYQKRILHVADILAELESRGVPFRMTMAGHGPQKDELLARCARWIDRGEFDYRGIVAHHAVDELLCEHDAYIMTSAFEGMPHAVLEAMSQGCVPVVTDIDSGIPELVRDGESGFRVPVGDTRAFADRFEELYRQPALLERLSVGSHRAIQQSRFNVDAMVDSYLSLFDRVLEEARSERYVRPRGTVLPPPAVVNGLSIFPCETLGAVWQTEKMLAEAPAELGAQPTRPVSWARRLWRALKRR